MNWDEMSPKERDALVSVEVMGAMVVKPPYTAVHPHYTTGIADAWLVMEKMQDRYQLGVVPTSFGAWLCRGYLPETSRIQVQCESVSEAICLAALRAVGVEV